MSSALLTWFVAWSALAAPLPCPSAPCTLGLRVHHAVPLDDIHARWIEAQVAEANRLFASIGLAFRVTETIPLPAALARPTTRADRDQLGHERFATGAIDLYLVAHLGDVDAPGQAIRGVHWRSRKDRARRWIILSTIASPLVLAHELGHFFGLPHGRDPASIMNKTPRTSPPPEARGFVERERQRISRQASTLLRERALTPLPPPAPPSP